MEPAMKTTSHIVVTAYGTLWARNAENIRHIPKRAAGVYILYDGSMPVYAGKGNIRYRVASARRSKRKAQLWDRFSWYALKDQTMMHDIEVLLLRTLPHNLRALTRQGGNFLDAKRVKPEEKEKVDYITRKPYKS
jgi:hypothetical protein